MQVTMFMFSVFPARAGVILRRDLRVQALLGVPRTGGGDPSSA